MHPTRIFKSPDELLKAWEGYKAWLSETESAKWLKIQYVGKEGDRVTDPIKLPYTLEGFKRYCRLHHGDVKSYFENHEGLYEDFAGICSQVREEIRENQITGGMIGHFNPSITQRLNGLADKRETEHSGKVDVITGMRIVNGTDL
jgi:hypothetical protein